MKNNILNWIKLSSFIFALSILFVSCNQDEMFEPDAQETTALRVVVGDFPAFGGNAQTRASNIGVPDAGKTHWVENDEIIISVKSEKYGTQYATLTYNGEEWCFDDYLKYLEGENEEDGTLEVTALYAPCYEVLDDVISLKEGMIQGMDEYLEVKCHIENRGVLQIPFSQAKRNYSRIRIACASEVKSIFIAAGRFTPAGIEKEYSEVFYNETPFSVDENGNAYIYGSFGKNDQNQYGWIYVEDWDIEHIPLIDYYYFTKATEPGKSYALYAGKKVDVDLSTLAATYVINDDAYYTFTGTGSYGIKVESGNPRIVMNNANITVNAGSAIDIPSGSTTTIQVIGDNTIGTTKTEFWDAPCGGIFVAEGGTVNITSNGTDNILRAHGTLAAAIGGKYDYDNNESYNAGSINISNVTVYAYTNNFYASAIGAAGEGTCGTINITNAVIYAYGAGDRWTSAPGIGNAWSLLDWSDTIPIVIISDSEVHTFRYNPYSDYIGYLGDESGDTYATGSINCGEGGSATNSTIYCYTGLDATTTDKVVTYDADGNPTEN